MKDLMNRLRHAAEQRNRYRRLRDEIAGMSWRDALDIGIWPGDADRIARETVYGR